MRKLSVIIPAYNEEKYIEDTLKSIRGDVEKIVVVNGCSDKTFEIAQKYAKVFCIEDKNVSKARNFGAKMALGNRFIFLDADIKLEDDILDKINSVDCSIGVCKAKADNDELFPKTLMFLKSLAHHLGYSTGLIFCDKEIFEEVGGFDEGLELGEDGKFLRSAMKLGKFKIVNGYVINSMRRFEKDGYLKDMWFWIRMIFQSKKNKMYEAVR
ncbi:MAG: glycosyltransferase [Nanoarchaeota archaeon]|nr:glycosyltransferase [Nanoarchaeota archaeon]